MQQRQPRLGDVVDDYCPRERRVTNHAVVAMVGDEIRQTRCTTCESEHVYKHARVPPQRRQKETPGALYQQVLAGMPRKVTPADRAGEPEAPPAPEPLHEPEAPEPDAVSTRPDEELEGPVHRRLIRATLPRMGNEAPVRREPDFTLRSPLHRPGKPGKGGPKGGGPRGHGGDQAANGNRAGGKRHGATRGPAGPWSRTGQPGFGRAQGGGRGRNKKRSR